MLAGPDLLVILVIALIVFGPKKLPELAQTIGKAIGEFKKTTEEVKESIGIKDLEEMRSNLTGMDLLADLAEKISTSIPSQEGKGGDSAPIVGNEKTEKEKSEKLEGAKGKLQRGGVPS